MKNLLFVGVYVTCPNCGSGDFVCLGGRFFRCRRCGCEWNDDAINI